MKKLMMLAFFSVLSLQSYATTIEISGWQKIEKAQSVSVEYVFNFKDHFDCKNRWECNSAETHGRLVDISLSGLGMIISQLNGQWGREMYKRDWDGKESMIKLQFSGYKNSCVALLSYRQHVNVVLQEDGSCVSM